RAFGVRSAMPIVTARRLCPHAVYLPNDFEAYTDYSHRIRTVFNSVTPLVEPLSLDEAFLDVSGAVRLFGTPEAIGRRIKSQVAELGLACTVGIAPNKFLAKLASTRAKPDGFLVIMPTAVDPFLHPLPVTALWGVGEQTAAVLRKLGLKTVADLAALTRRTLQRGVGDALGAHLYDLARGRDERPVVPNEPARSLGAEETYERDLTSTGEVLRELLRLADRTGGRLRARSLCCRTITLKVRYSNFKTITRSKTLPEEIDTGAELFGTARALYLRLIASSQVTPRIRLLGLSTSGLAPGPPRRQLDLLHGPQRPGWHEATQAVDDIRRRFGDSAVTAATLLPTASPEP
ncbi:MAG TPA: DNA polymerase IV, partial [Actinomycetota bacterium]|nr:DNA polymerase IV [Actinomycetota bacterium]